MKNRRLTVIALMFSIGMFTISVLPVSADIAGDASTTEEITPELVDGNPNCQTLGYEFGFKPQPEPTPNGDYTDGVLFVSILNYDGFYFNWISNIGVDAVIVKGGSNADNFRSVFSISNSEEIKFDTGLHAPFKDNGTARGISHQEFCYDIEEDTEPCDCELLGDTYDPGPPPSIQVRVQDTGSGINSIDFVLDNVEVINTTPADYVGSIDPIFITFEQIITTIPGTFLVNAVDGAGNTCSCDPVFTLVIREKGKPATELHTGLPSIESKVTITNGDPGVKNLDIVVNGKKFKVAGLGNGEETTIDISSAMDGDDNTVILIARGKPGSEVNVMISD